MAYSNQISRAEPSCFLFLIDQSTSMKDPFGGEAGRSKAERLADAINRLLFELVFRCTKNQEEGPRNYFDVGIIGYGSNVGPAWSGKLANKELVNIADLANNPVRVDPKTKKEDDGAGGLVDVTVNLPVWFEPVANGGTPMRSAFEQANRIVEGWVRDHPTSYPPTIINITDGEANPEHEPEAAADAIQQLATQDGNALVFNLHLSDKAGQAILFPESEATLPDTFARKLFAISSALPPHIRSEAAKEGYAVGEGARGFVFGADGVELIRFLDIGTRITGIAEGR